jgi:hypothetical protein
MEMRIKQNARPAWPAHFSSFPKKIYVPVHHELWIHYPARTATFATQGRRSSLMTVHCQLMKEHYCLSIFTLVFQEELSDSTLVDNS